MRRGTMWRLATRAEMATLRAARPSTLGVPLLTSAALPFVVSAQLVACNCKVCGQETGWLDTSETGNPCDPNYASGEDQDGDGLINGQESAHETDPFLPDSDIDGIDDKIELALGTDPLHPDTDGGGAFDGFELASGTDPLLAGDDVPPKPGDQDEDSLSDWREIVIGTSPASPDTDLDGLGDGDEAYTHKTNPLAADTDRDGQTDGDEVAHWTDPKNACVP